MSYSNQLVSFKGAWSSGTQYTYPTLGNVLLNPDITTDFAPMVTYNGSLYVANGSAVPTLGTAPSSDSAWTNVATSESTTGVLATPLTGYSATSGTISGISTILQAFENVGYALANPDNPLSQVLTGFTPTDGTPSSASTILQAIEYLSTPTYYFLPAFAVASVTAVALTIAGGTAAKSANITVATTNISLPLNKILLITVQLNVTTSSTSGATFTLTGANCTVTQQAQAVGESVTNGILTLTGVVVTTGTASPVLTIVASDVTGTVAINNTSTILLQDA